MWLTFRCYSGHIVKKYCYRTLLLLKWNSLLILFKFKMSLRESGAYALIIADHPEIMAFRLDTFWTILALTSIFYHARTDFLLGSFRLARLHWGTILVHSTLKSTWMSCIRPYMSHTTLMSSVLDQWAYSCEFRVSPVVSFSSKWLSVCLGSLPPKLASVYNNIYKYHILKRSF